MKVVADPSTLDAIRIGGGAVHIWPCRLCCAGGHVLEASLSAPSRRELTLVCEEPISVYAPPGMRLPKELHLEAGRRGRVRAFWEGLAWIA